MTIFPFSIPSIILLVFKFKILGSECQTSGTYAKRAKQAANNDKFLCFLN
jgi:hypothetical protein